MAGITSVKTGIMTAVGQYYAPPPTYITPPGRRSSGLATIGGSLIIISGILGMILALMIFWGKDNVDFTSIYQEYGYEISAEEIQAILNVCVAVLFIFAIIAILGGIMAMTKKSWGMGILGGIFALFCIGPYGIASLLGLIGLIFVAVSRGDFKRHQPTPPQVVFVQSPQPPMPPNGSKIYCAGCGKQIEESFKVCPYCERPCK